MATKIRKQRVLHYKHAKINPLGKTLQGYLANAFKISPKPKDRLEKLGQDNNLNQFINSNRSQQGMLFGQMVLFEPGRDQAIIVLDDLKDEFPIDTLPIPSRNDGTQQEFLDSVLYFGILENHIVLLQSQTLKSREFEKHLLWFLNDCSNVLPANASLIISDQPTLEAKAKIEALPVKKISIGTPLQSKDSSTQPTEKAVVQPSTIRYTPYGKGFEILRSILGAEWMKSLRLEDSLDEANLRVNLEITYLRKTTQKAHEILDNIATAMRHAEPEDVRVDLQGGGSIKGEEMRLSGRISVNVMNGIIDSSDLYNQMHIWLQQRIVEGTVA